jgi:thiosulfate sulfurtransferase
MSTKPVFSHLSCEQLFNEKDNWTLVDIRDPQSYAMSHVEGAIALNNENIGDFINETLPTQPVAVMCYHGHSSQQAAEYIASQGVETVASVDGGFEYWRQHFPVTGAQ